MTARSFALAAGAITASLLIAYPVYVWQLRREVERRAAFELAQFDESCRLARQRLALGGELWSARIMANKCDAAGR
ncbi:hypothetical protein [Aureimonas endophytica]|uniref:hypothetical protein n=1 Tax=Aureimonas endophytica TaxID=2027858 RepID=UPI001AEE9E34|nr:hypothetical protein [Aureimonas endophytica]